MLEPNQPQSAAADRVKWEKPGWLRPKAPKSGQKVIREGLIHENETGMPGERLLVQSFLSLIPCLSVLFAWRLILSLLRFVFEIGYIESWIFLLLLMDKPNVPIALQDS